MIRLFTPPHTLVATLSVLLLLQTGHAHRQSTLQSRRILTNEFPPEARSSEINSRFVHHMRVLLGRGRELEEESLGEGGPWARRLVCEPGCLHGGICELDPKTKEPICLCPLPDPKTEVYFRGRSCQTEAVRCNSTWWCENGGTCQKTDSSAAGEQPYTCQCPTKYQGLKCQTPVAQCGDGELWCANGGECVFSGEVNATICKCPSTHTGTNCETLVEPQDLGSPDHHAHSNFTSPVVMPSDSSVELLEEEQRQYFKAFFLIFGVFLTIWVTALAAVHCPRPRHELKRRLAALSRGELAPLRGEGTPKRAVPPTQNVKVVERLPSRQHVLPVTIEAPEESRHETDEAEEEGETHQEIRKTPESVRPLAQDPEVSEQGRQVLWNLEERMERAAVDTKEEKKKDAEHGPLL